MLSIKKGRYGARLGPVPGVVLIFLIVMEVAQEFGVSVQITSGREGKHMIGSLHIVDMAFDFKFPSVSSTILIEMNNAIRERLGDDYDTKATTTKKIIHVEYQPKQPLGKL